MSLTKSKGNMYPWVTHTHSHLGGECPHRCSYCYVDNPRFGRPAKYTGPIRLLEGEFGVKYGAGKTIFIENCNDLFAEAVPYEFICRILKHCQEWPHNTYVFQTKNPGRMRLASLRIPANSIVGTTIETNRHFPEVMRDAPTAWLRHWDMMLLRDARPDLKLFVTIEPILSFDLEILVEGLIALQPDFVNIGADSKGKGLPEPSGNDVRALIAGLHQAGIELRQKHNLDRLLSKP